MSAAHELIIQYPLAWRKKEPERLPEPALRDELVALRAGLPGTMQRSLQTAAELRQRLARSERTLLPSMFAPFDELTGGLERGKLTELSGRRSTGRFSIVLSALAAATQIGEAAALIDLGDGLDPETAERAGIDLRRLLWARPESLKHAVMAAEKLIATGFPLVVVDLGLHLRGRRPAEAAWVRLARSAESQHAALLVSSPFPLSGTAADAVVTLRGNATWRGAGKSPRLLEGIGSTMTLEKHRRLKPGRRRDGAVRSEP